MRLNNRDVEWVDQRQKERERYGEKSKESEQKKVN